MKDVLQLSRLLQRLNARDQGAVEEIYRQYFTPCAKVVLNHGGSVDDAREAFQETLFSLAIKLQNPAFSIKSNLGGYLSRSCYYIWVKTKTERLKTVSPENAPESPSPPSQLIEKNEQERRYEKMYHCMGKMNIDQRKLLQLTYFQNKKDKEIARLLDLSVEYVKNKRRRCMISLRKCMGVKK